MRRAVLLAVVLLCAAPAVAAATLVSMTVAPAQPNGDNGWYRTPVMVRFVVDAAATTVTGDCAHFPGSTTDIPVNSETALKTLTCDATNGSGGDGQKAFIHIDWTAPSAAVGAERAADAGGFYNHPLTAKWSGVDAISGVASCTATPYGGPDGIGVSLSGTCRDKAGNVSAPAAFVFNYDATPPSLTDVTAKPDDASVRLAWQASGASRVTVTRSSGTARAAQGAVVYDGAGTEFTDTGLKNGSRYTYVVQALDPAGNATSDSVAVTPAAEASTEHLLSPGFQSRLSRAPMLRWREVRRASYYNVQLFRKGKKILSAWPTKPHYQLRKAWKYRGKRHRLMPGTYWWYIWAGYGHRSEHRYGKLLGMRSFTVT